MVVVVPDGFEGEALTDARDAAATGPTWSPWSRAAPRDRSPSRRAWEHCGLDVEIVLVHDAARALTPRAVFDRVVAAVDAGAVAVIPTLPVVDTIKRVDAEGHVIAAVDRSELAAAQTPQGFRRDVSRGGVAQRGRRPHR